MWPLLQEQFLLTSCKCLICEQVHQFCSRNCLCSLGTGEIPFSGSETTHWDIGCPRPSRSNLKESSGQSKFPTWKSPPAMLCCTEEWEHSPSPDFSSIPCLREVQMCSWLDWEFLHHPEYERLKFPGHLSRHHPGGRLNHNYKANLTAILRTWIL